jgi:hypothetical protein
VCGDALLGRVWEKLLDISGGSLNLANVPGLFNIGSGCSPRTIGLPLPKVFEEQITTA